MQSVGRGFESSDELLDAAYRGDATQVTQLIDSGARVDHRVTRRGFDGWTPLHFAARSGHVKVVDVLLSHDAEVNARDNNGATVVYRSAQNGHPKVVERLVAAKADVDIKNSRGRSPVSIATEMGHDSVVDVLIAAGADIRAGNEDGLSPLHVAIQFNRRDIAEILVKAGADVNSQCNSGTSPLMLAASLGQDRVVRTLLRSSADPALKQRCGITAFELACCYGHVDTALVLIKHCYQANIDASVSLSPVSAAAYEECIRLLKVPLPSAKAHSQLLEAGSCISERLHAELLLAGFHETRAALQAAAATFLEGIVRMRRGSSCNFIVGSYAEGWGSSLVSLNGRIDVNSDIDLTQFSPDEPLHINGSCTCENAKPDRVVQYEDGHVKYGSLGSNPATANSGSALRPAVDIVAAIQCCCYPHVPVIHDHPLRATNIAPSIIQTLKAELETSQCHLVCANPPGQSGQLRVSTTLLERRLLRSLTTVQGQLFVILKYLLKHEICMKCNGLKTYHVKTLLFRMLDETPEMEWRPCNLLQLTQRALQKLLSCLQSSSHPDHCMTHFFIKDAAIYFRSGYDTKEQIAGVVRNTIENLPALFDNLMGTLRPAGDLFQFHPFLIIPDIFLSRSAAQSDRLSYGEIYDAVCEILVQLCSQTSDEGFLQSRICSLPDCALTARQSLAVMACLRFGRRDDAQRILRDSQSVSVCRGIRCPIGSPAPTDGEVQQRLESTNSAWRFLFWLNDRPELSFLPQFARQHFPCHSVYFTYHYMNFDALLKCLCLELIPDDVNPCAWFKEMLQRNDCDKQDLLMGLKFCKDIEMLMQLIRRHKAIVCAEPEVTKMVADLSENSELRESCIRATLEEMRQQLRDFHAGGVSK